VCVCVCVCERERERERENLAFDSLIYFEPVEIFKNRSNVMTFRSFGDNT